MLTQRDAETLIDRLQHHALADAPGTMSDLQVDAALGLLDRVLPDLHGVELTTSNLRRILVTWSGERRLGQGTVATHVEFGVGGSPNDCKDPLRRRTTYPDRSSASCLSIRT